MSNLKNQQNKSLTAELFGELFSCLQSTIWKFTSHI